jgi:cysteinyl-tRNA synthetase
VGNIRPAVVFDTLRRFLSFLGYDVKLVSNFTDVDDKIINKALQEGVAEQVITERYIAAYKDVLSKLNIQPHYLNPRVTEYMPQIINYIDELVKLGAAYEKDGDVFFRISAIKDYGELSNMKVVDLVVGARIEENSKKESPLDFTLWKKTDVGIQWDSPWGKGRPGWHTECCVMINSIFGGQIDIHGGGFDLKFPHHENEIAQAKVHDHNKIANVWMHNGFVNFGSEKMSKSLGNVVLAKDAIAKYGGNVMRWLILSTHYRAPVSFTEETAQSCSNELSKIQKVYYQLAVAIQLENGELDSKDIHIEEFVAALADDLNTSNAIAAIFEKVKAANVELRKNPKNLQEIQGIFASLKAMLDIFGIVFKMPILTTELRKTYEEYMKLKSEKRFEESDKLRDVLIQNNII